MATPKKSTGKQGSAKTDAEKRQALKEKIAAGEERQTPIARWAMSAPIR
jgi:hypothetical protein